MKCSIILICCCSKVQFSKKTIRHAARQPADRKTASQREISHEMFSFEGMGSTGVKWVKLRRMIRVDVAPTGFIPVERRFGYQKTILSRPFLSASFLCSPTRSESASKEKNEVDNASGIQTSVPRGQAHVGNGNANVRIQNRTHSECHSPQRMPLSEGDALPCPWREMLAEANWGRDEFEHDSAGSVAGWSAWESDGDSLCRDDNDVCLGG